MYKSEFKSHIKQYNQYNDTMCNYTFNRGSNAGNKCQVKQRQGDFCCKHRRAADKEEGKKCCNYVFVRGDHKGSRCTVSPRKGDYCCKHNKKEIKKEIKVELKEEKEAKEEKEEKEYNLI